MNNQQQAGFGAAIIIAAVLVIAVLGLIGWKLYSLYSKPVAKTTTNQASNTQTGTTGNTNTSDQATYLDIKELGIKIKLDVSIKDAAYAMYYTPSTDGSTVVGISTQSLIDKETGNYCEASHGPLGIIIKTSDPNYQTGPNTTIAPNGKDIFKLGNNYYWYRKPQNDGCAVGQVTPAMQDAAISAFAQAFTTVQLDN